MTFCHSIGEKRKEKTSSNSKDDPLSSLFHTVSLCPPWAVSNRVTELLLGIWKETFFANVAELYKAFEMWKLGYSQQEKIILSRILLIFQQRSLIYIWTYFHWTAGFTSDIHRWYLQQPPRITAVQLGKIRRKTWMPLSPPSTPATQAKHNTIIPVVANIHAVSPPFQNYIQKGKQVISIHTIHSYSCFSLSRWVLLFIPRVNI